MSRFKVSWLLVAALAMVFSVGFAACGGDDDDAAPEVTDLDLTIGQLLPQTGDLSPFAPAGGKAAELAIEQIEAAIEEVGADHTVTMITEDTQTADEAAVTAARRVTGEGATCIAGAWASGSTIPVAESVTIRQGILQISPASTSPDITELEDDGLVNRTAPSDAFQGPVLADIVEEGLGEADGVTINVGARNDPYGTDLADAFTEGWEAKGGVVGETVIYDTDLPSYDSEAGQLVSGDPDGWFIVDFPEPFDRVGAALVRTGDWDPERTFVPDGLATPDLPQNVGQQVTEGMRATAPGAGASPGSEAFADLFDEAPGAGRGPFDAQNFDAVVLCYLAAVAAGSTEGSAMADELQGLTNEPGTEYTFEDLPAAIEALQNGEEINYMGASGPISLDENGDPAGGVYGIFAFRGDQMEQTAEVGFGDEEENGDADDDTEE